MAVTLLRIDDRLIHGQIMHAWLSYSKATTIMVADDALMQDKMHQTMLKFVASKTVKLVMESVKDAAKMLKELPEDEDVLLIMRNPQTAAQLFNEGFYIDYINLGNISNSKSTGERFRVLKNIHPTLEDIKSLRDLSSKGVKIEIKLVPNDKPLDVIDLLNKNNL